ncbi:protein-L-isoaspartate(D-aspartate) O-methyltransferase [Fulvivirga ulvae]|uniref:protein-L-isoaspartate(D-aspartate) O-methyltransferase n=1 Tax=Fulvivirga ulvae TaxID=2904245 RepID=UPI001F37DDC4|nr:protein-L-isoaspartate(D-aspartate) O-methyltransferase [Fulvivirga ulvae]UII30513.1 protein-L-isoaspartate(D-aspartate) O-methyltransferase [Fulvivirga ulvae]
MEDSYKHRGMRRSLLKTLRGKGITNEAVLAAIGKVPRHFFFDNALLEHAYQDKAFPIGEGQTISQPYTVAFQSEKLNVKEGCKVLEIGTGSGYQACVLVEMGANVYTIEYNKVLYERTRKFLPLMGYRPRFFHGDGSKGLPRHAPFDRIIVTAGAPSVPDSLIKQLNIGGILIIPVGDNERQKMLRITRIDEKKLKKEEFDFFSFVPLKGEEGWGR